jgi:hypothetical protein
VGRELPIIDADACPAGALIREMPGIPPLSDAVCQEHIAAALLRFLPEALCRRKLTVIANGPSALRVDLADIDGLTLALNGALKLFLDRGLAPTYWAACDPQALVADFIPDNPPKKTVYLVASKCHPDVFDKLKGCPVVVWHVSDQPVPGMARVPVEPSITLSASWLLHRMAGITDFVYWGWDGCYMDGRHHASIESDDAPAPLTLNYGGSFNQDGEVPKFEGGRDFPTTHAWAAEAMGANQFFQLAKYFDIGITINGDGLFRAEYDAAMKAGEKQ